MRHIIFQNKKILYRAEGKGKPVILIHGFGEDGNIWNTQLERLTKNYFVIIPDLPGSGKSEMLEGNRLIDDYAEVIKAIADKEITENKKTTFSIIGHSMGGYITLAFAEKYPELLNSFGLFHSSAFADDEAKIETRKKGIEFIKKNGTEAFLKTSTHKLFSEKTKTEKPELIEKLIQMAKQISPEAMIQYYEAMILRPNRTSILRKFSKPILFIIGKYDTAVSLETSLNQCHIPAVSSVHILQNSGHEGMLEEPELSASYLEVFLNNFV
ncbi:MAG: alpha/beta hydrolase [Bacteroidota bacterium]|nr:alpha/beta hydrolase [Bacteroidota bacterium]